MPTIPNKFAQFLQAGAARFPHLWPDLKDQLDNMPNLREVAMLVYRLNASGTVTGTAIVQVVPDTTPLFGAAGGVGFTHRGDSTDQADLRRPAWPRRTSVLRLGGNRDV